jgi:hypothetical protein
MFACLAYQIRHALVVPFVCVINYPTPGYNEGIPFVKYILTKTILTQ